MNYIWNKNLELLKKRFPGLFSDIKEKISLCVPENPENLPVEFGSWKIDFAKNGQPTAWCLGNAVHSTYNPTQEAERLATALTQNAESKNVFVFCGIGLGYGAVAFAKKNPSAKVVVIEPDYNCMAAAFFFLDLTPLLGLENFAFLPEVPHSDVISVLEKFGLMHCHFVMNKATSAFSKKYFDNLEILVQRNKAKNQINIRTLDKFGSLWQRNSCKNLKNISFLDGVSRYKDCAAGLSACVVAAGPSLDGILPFLAEIKKRCLLICVDTALRACLRVGVEPDFVLIVDPQYWNFRHICGLSATSSVLIAELAAYPAVFDFPCKEIILCSSMYPVGKYFEQICGAKGTLGAGGSVATTAWDFAAYCGCKEVFMAGLDLAYPENKTHAKGSLFEEKALESATRITPVDNFAGNSIFSAETDLQRDYLGKPILTDNRMKLYAWWFESHVAKENAPKTYSFSAESLAIPGIKYFSVQDFLCKPVATKQRSDFFENEKKLYEKFKSESDVRLQVFNKALKHFLNNLSDLEKFASEGINICDSLLQTENQTAFLNNFNCSVQKLESVDKKILSSSASQVAALVFPGQEKLEIIFAKAHLPTDENRATIVKSRIIYEQVKKAVADYLALLSE